LDCHWQWELKRRPVRGAAAPFSFKVRRRQKRWGGEGGYCRSRDKKLSQGRGVARLDHLSEPLRGLWVGLAAGRKGRVKRAGPARWGPMTGADTAVRVAFETRKGEGIFSGRPKVK